MVAADTQMPIPSLLPVPIIGDSRLGMGQRYVAERSIRGGAFRAYTAPESSGGYASDGKEWFILKKGRVVNLYV